MHSGNLTKKIKILLIGPLPPPLGGTSVSFQCMIEAIREQQLAEIDVINTAGVRGKGMKGVVLFIKKLANIFRKSRENDFISLHASTTGLPFISPLVFIAAKFYRKPFILRKFGGSDYTEVHGWIISRILDMIVKRSNLYLLQTRRLIQKAKDRNLLNVEWLPTHRKLPIDCGQWQSKNKLKCRRFVYVGHVRENKGIRVLAESAGLIHPDISIDIFGPWFSDLEKNIFDNIPNIKYKGVLQPSEVMSTLCNYDGFVFPTMAASEGYPGSIIEAFIAGLPVITTRCGAIPEIVDESVGILVKPGDSVALAEAIDLLASDDSLFRRLSLDVLERAKMFSASEHAKAFISMLLQYKSVKKIKL